MATSLTLDAHVAGITAAMRMGMAATAAAGLDTVVPTCPDWTVRRLVAHTGMVHRWATALLDGEPERVGDGSDAEAEGLASADPLAWWQDGATALTAAIAAAPDDLDAFVFLRDAPPPKRFWARRQCHETTIHAVDAVAAQLGRRPVASEVEIADAVALDGIDELATGFITRTASRLRTEVPRRVLLRPDAPQAPAWLIDVGPEPAVTTVVGADGDPAAVDTDVELTGSPVGMYLALWNRAADGELVGDPATVAWWSQLVTITWS